MIIFNKIFLLVVVSATLISCGETHHLAKGDFSTNETFNINSYYGCCGCEAKYFIIYAKKRKNEQVIYSYNCGGKGVPTKFIFNYNKRGHLISCEQYIATTRNDFTVQLSQQERLLFARVDTNVLLKPEYIIIKLSEIKGFRKPVAYEGPHPFPLIKKGYKVPVH